MSFGQILETIHW